MTREDSNGNNGGDEDTITEEPSTASLSSTAPAPKVTKVSRKTSAKPPAKPTPVRTRQPSPLASRSSRLRTQQGPQTPRNASGLDSSHSTPVRFAPQSRIPSTVASATPAPSCDVGSPILQRRRLNGGAAPVTAHRFSLDADKIRQIEALADADLTPPPAPAMAASSTFVSSSSPGRSSSQPPSRSKDQTSSSLHERTEMLLQSSAKRVTPKARRKLPVPAAGATPLSRQPQPTRPPPSSAGALDQTVVLRKLEEVRRSRMRSVEKEEPLVKASNATFRTASADATFRVSSVDAAGDATFTAPNARGNKKLIDQDDDGNDSDRPGPDPSSSARKEAWADKRPGEPKDLTSLLESFVENAGRVLQSASDQHKTLEEESAADVEEESTTTEEEGAKASTTITIKSNTATPHHQPHQPQQQQQQHHPARPAIQNKTLSKLMNMLESSECSVMALSTASSRMESCLSQDTGIGSMPSSMILSMGASQDMGGAKAVVPAATTMAVNTEQDQQQPTSLTDLESLTSVGSNSSCEKKGAAAIAVSPIVEERPDPKRKRTLKSVKSDPMDKAAMTSSSESTKVQFLRLYFVRLSRDTLT